MTEVEYRTIERFPGYRVGSDGSVWSRWKNRGGIGDDWKRMSPSKNRRNGYLFVQLRIAPCRRKFMQVHALVLEAFVGPCPPGMEARHFPDRDKTKNVVGNLSWGTRQENADDRTTHGTASAAYGEDHHKAKLTVVQVVEARALSTAGEPVANLARRYGVDYGTMQKAVLRKTWKTVA